MRIAIFATGLLLIGVAVPAEAQVWGECAALPGNLVGTLNCDFMDDVSHWTFSSVVGFWAPEQSTGFPTPPSGSATAADPSSYSFTVSSDCIVVSAGTDYTLGLYSRTPGGATIGCVGRIEEFSSADCTGGSTVSPDGPFTPALNQWTSWSTVWTSSLGTQSARGWIECSADASFTVLFDNIAFVEGSQVPVELQSFIVN